MKDKVYGNFQATLGVNREKILIKSFNARTGSKVLEFYNRVASTANDNGERLTDLLKVLFISILY